MTCRTCLTLNPPGAPACVRCNTPLEPAATVGSKQIGPGLAAPPRAEPGSSRAGAAAVQPPGYGPPEPEPVVAPPAPARPGSGRRAAVAGLLVVALLLAGGGAALLLIRPSYLDTAAVAAALGGELTARLGGPVAVTCPDGVRSRAGERFDCTARDAAGTTRSVTVTVLDGAGRYRWELAR